MADRLIRVFFKAVNLSWPVIEEAAFRTRYLAFKADRAFGAGGWEAMLYMIMAAAARHVQLLQRGKDLGNISPDISFSRPEALRQDTGFVPASGTVIGLQTLLPSSLYLALTKSLARYVF